MRVLGLVPYPLDTAPGQRYRWEQWAPYLRAQGIDIVFVPFGDDRLARLLYEPSRYVGKAAGMIRGLVRRAGDAFKAKHFDAVLVQREASLVGPAWAERLAKSRRPFLIYDFDDAVWMSYVSPTNRYLSYLKVPSKTRTLCRMASVVIAGNESLASYARQYNSNVHAVPSTVSLRSYRPRASRSSGPPVIGWTGSHSSAQYLPAVFGALRRLRSRREFRLLVIGTDGIRVEGIDTECRPWSAAREVEDLWDMDVGIMPLPDESWTRHKCGMKAIQYMGVGIPAVVSPVGANQEIVTHGERGYHATTEDQWVEALDRILGDDALRRTLGAKAREAVVKHYSAESQIPRLVEILRGRSA